MKTKHKVIISKPSFFKREVHVISDDAIEKDDFITLVTTKGASSLRVHNGDSRFLNLSMIVTHKKVIASSEHASLISWDEGKEVITSPFKITYKQKLKILFFGIKEVGIEWEGIHDEFIKRVVIN